MERGEEKVFPRAGSLFTEVQLPAWHHAEAENFIRISYMCSESPNTWATRDYFSMTLSREAGPAVKQPEQEQACMWIPVAQQPKPIQTT